MLTTLPPPCDREMAANQPNVLERVKGSWHTVQPMLTGPGSEKTISQSRRKKAFKQPLELPRGSRETKI